MLKLQPAPLRDPHQPRGSTPIAQWFMAKLRYCGRCEVVKTMDLSSFQCRYLARASTRSYPCGCHWASWSRSVRSHGTCAGDHNLGIGWCTGWFIKVGTAGTDVLNRLLAPPSQLAISSVHTRARGKVQKIKVVAAKNMLLLKELSSCLATPWRLKNDANEWSDFDPIYPDTKAIQWKVRGNEAKTVHGFA